MQKDKLILKERQACRAARKILLKWNLRGELRMWDKLEITIRFVTMGRIKDNRLVSAEDRSLSV